MTIEQQLLLQIYASQRVHQAKILEVACAIMEKLEGQDEPSGLFFQIVKSDIDPLISSLASELGESWPRHNPFLRDQVITEETIRLWIETAVNNIMNTDAE